jgi:phosphoribosyl 1,2-cyclic phosphate phosphodiesterase
MGVDEVRRFNMMQRSAIPAYADARTCADLRRMFNYIFDPPAEKSGGTPQIDLHTIDGPFTLQTLHVQPITIFHGQRPILGFRFGSFAYLTDCSRIPDESFDLLQNLDVLVLDALRHRPHPTHFTVGEALEVVERLRPRQTFFTHICHDLPHKATNATLPDSVQLAFDGLTLDVHI